MNVLWRSSVGAEYAKTFSSDLFSIHIENDRAKARELKDSFEILVDGNPPAELLDGKALKHVVIPYTGINKSLQDNLLERPHLKLYNSHFNANYVAEHALALLLACTHSLLPADTHMRRGEWKPGPSNLHSLHLDGKTCLLLGYGTIAKSFRSKAAGLGLAFTAFKRQQQHEDIKVYTSDTLHEALAEADVIMASLPGTPDTRGILDHKAFAAMKPDAVLVNVGRGDVIVQEALYDALKSGQLKAAGIDVWWNYPNRNSKPPTYPADVPLHELDNIIMSPHRANLVNNWQEDSFTDAIKTLEAIVRGDNRNQVDVTRGY